MKTAAEDKAYAFKQTACIPETPQLFADSSRRTIAPISKVTGGNSSYFANLTQSSNTSKEDKLLGNVIAVKNPSNVKEKLRNLL